MGASSVAFGGKVGVEVLIKEEKRRLPVSRQILSGATAMAFQLTGKKPGDISVVVCDDEYITQLNERYTGRSGPTDVLSFPMREGEFSDLSGALLGDIVISAETAAKQATEYGTTLEEEFLFLYIHGLLHLLGYTHETPMKEREMVEFSRKILSLHRRML